MTRTIIIGDLHGCWDELRALLEAVAQARDDRIIALGDIVDRGPDSEKVVEFFREAPNAVSLMGNHERKHVRAAAGLTEAALSQRIVQVQLGDRYPAWLAFMATFPRHLELPEAILVHGFFESGVPLEQQRDTVVIGTLTGEDYITKTCRQPWYDQYDGPKPLVVGHHDYLRTGEALVRNGHFYAIDTGCVYGRRLTALVLPEFRLVSVPARQDHWGESRHAYALLAGSTRSDLDLDWDTLAAFAKTVIVESTPAQQRERAERCARLARECGVLATRICHAAADVCDSIFGALELAEDWKTLDLKRRASRFAQRVHGHPAAALLFQARKGRQRARTGRLDEAFVFRAAKTPRALAALASQLGIETRLEEDEE